MYLVIIIYLTQTQGHRQITELCSTHKLEQGCSIRRLRSNSRSRRYCR